MIETITALTMLAFGWVLLALAGTRELLNGRQIINIRGKRIIVPFWVFWNWPVFLLIYLTGILAGMTLLIHVI